MPVYGFHEELVAISNGQPLSFSFFEKVKRLVRDQVRRYPASLWEPGLGSWDEDAVWVVVDDFVANYLFEKKGGQIRSLLCYARKSLNLDGLMVTMFRQYVGDILARQNPQRTNLKKRIREILAQLEGSGLIEARSRASFKEYRSRKSLDDNFVHEEQLKSRTGELPTWKLVQYGSDSKKASPLIGTEDLRKLTASCFDAHPGWIRESTLTSFLFNHIFLPQGELRLPEPSDVEQNLDEWLERIVESRGTDGDQLLKVHLKDVYKNLSDRRREIFRLHFIVGLSSSQIAADLDLSVSLVYGEIEGIREVFQMELS